VTSTTRDHRESWEACPDPEMLSVYLDGKLDETQRVPMEEHISRCEDCYFVVREWAALGSAEGSEAAVLPHDTAEPALSLASPDKPVPDNVVPMNVGREAPVPAGTEAPVPVSPGLPRPFASRLLPMAATLVMAAGALLLWRQTHPVDPYVEAVRPLVDAVGKRRFFDARLTGAFQYGERISPKRGGDPTVSPGVNGPATEDWAILAAAARIKEDIGRPQNAGERAALASVHLILGETDEAIRELSNGIDGADSDALRAQLLSNRAAAHVTRAMARNESDSYAQALDDTTRALKLAPGLVEALYNRALSLEGLGRGEEAIAAWDAFVSSEKDLTWREEGTRRRNSLRGGPGTTPK
jgi:hypothetical protein